jgi:hypothetical protein
MQIKMIKTFIGCLLLGIAPAFGQLDGNTIKLEGIGVDNTSKYKLKRKSPSLLSPEKTGIGFKYDSIQLRIDDKPALDITIDNKEFLDPHLDGYKPKFFKDADLSEEEGNSDQYLGDFKTKGKFITVYCRDHQFVDGDRVKLMQNNVVLKNNIILTGRDKPVLIDLEDGFNQIDFIALNQGSSGPNTAQFRVYDEAGELLAVNVWNLSTGGKGTLIVVKE